MFKNDSAKIGDNMNESCMPCKRSNGCQCVIRKLIACQKKKCMRCTAAGVVIMNSFAVNGSPGKYRREKVLIHCVFNLLLLKWIRENIIKTVEIKAVK